MSCDASIVLWLCAVALSSDQLVTVRGQIGGSASPALLVAHCQQPARRGGGCHAGGSCRDGSSCGCGVCQCTSGRARASALQPAGGGCRHGRRERGGCTLCHCATVLWARGESSTSSQCQHADCTHLSSSVCGMAAVLAALAHPRTESQRHSSAVQGDLTQWSNGAASSESPRMRKRTSAADASK